jgi:hypothetical protein
VSLEGPALAQASIDGCSENTSLSLGFTLRRKRSDDFQGTVVISTCSITAEACFALAGAVSLLSSIIAGKCRSDCCRRSRRSSAITIPIRLRRNPRPSILRMSFLHLTKSKRRDTSQSSIRTICFSFQSCSGHIRRACAVPLSVQPTHIRR